MDLVPVEAEAAAADTHAGHDHSGTGGELWTCPMHPEIVDEQAGDCPICGMDLVPMEGGGGSAGSEMGDSMAAEGRTVVELDPGVVQRMNVTTEVARRQEIERTVRAAGSLVVDPAQVVTVTTKFPGFVERVYANYEGQRVGRGQALFEVFSPELVQTQEELLSAVDYARRLEASGGADRGGEADAVRRAWALVDAAERRLSYWDISRVQIERLKAEGEVQRTLTVTAPASGVVTERLAGLQGMAIQPGIQALELANLGSLLVEADVYESQIGQVGVGSRAVIEPRAFPGASYRGTVRFVEPALDPTTRAARLVIAVDNRDGRLQPGMYATVLLTPGAPGAPGAGDLGPPPVTVSNQAVLRTGRRDLVVVDLGGGRFAPREVVTGTVEDGRIQILSGLDEGERVVTSAQFLIDSESNLRAAIQQMRSERQSAGAGGS
jgi:RND family efflux transporter MFP subunit